MFKISHKLNKKAEISVFFTDKDCQFKNVNNFFTKESFDNIGNLIHKHQRDNFLSVSFFENNQRKNILIIKIQNNFKDYDFQKIGGSIYDKISSYENANLFLNSLENFDKIKYNFIENLFLGLFSKSYNFSNYKQNQKNKIKFSKLFTISYKIKKTQM